MKNYATIVNDGTCIYFNSFVKPRLLTKIILLLLNAILISLISALIHHTAVSSESSENSFGIYIILPSIYLLVVGRFTLWNIAGSELIIINKKSVSLSRRYGPFTMPLSVKTFDNKLNIEIHKEKVYEHVDYGTITFFKPHEVTGVLLPILSSSIYIPVEQLEHVVSHIFLLAGDPVAGWVHSN